VPHSVPLGPVTVQRHDSRPSLVVRVEPHHDPGTVSVHETDGASGHATRGPADDDGGIIASHDAGFPAGQRERP